MLRFSCLGFGQVESPESATQQEPELASIQRLRYEDDKAQLASPLHELTSDDEEGRQLEPVYDEAELKEMRVPKANPFGGSPIYKNRDARAVEAASIIYSSTGVKRSDDGLLPQNKSFYCKLSVARAATTIEDAEHGYGSAGATPLRQLPPGKKQPPHTQRVERARNSPVSRFSLEYAGQGVRRDSNACSVEGVDGSPARVGSLDDEQSHDGVEGAEL